MRPAPFQHPRNMAFFELIDVVLDFPVFSSRSRGVVNWLLGTDPQANGDAFIVA